MLKKQINIYDYFDRRSLVSAFILTIAIIVLESILVNVSYQEYFSTIYAEQGFDFLFICAAYVAFSLFTFYLFVLFAQNSTWKFKIIYFLFYCFAAFYEFGYRSVIGRESDMLDMEAAFSATSEQSMSAILSYISFLAIIPCTLFLIFIVFKGTRKAAFGLKHFSILLMIQVVFCFHLTNIRGLFVDGKFPTVTTAAFSRSTVDFLYWGTLFNGNLQKRVIIEKPPFAEDFRPANNIILVIDESVSGKHLSLNGYERSTTPFLEKLEKEDILKNWGIVAGATTSSHATYDVIITGLTPDDLPDPTQFKIKTSPTIFQYAKAMNYKTLFFDAQSNKYWGGIANDLNYIDVWQGVNELNANGELKEYDRDSKIADIANKIVSTSTGNFILIFKKGAHIPYQDSFDPAKEIWKPSYQMDGIRDMPAESKFEEVRNAYDNAIANNLDSFFQELVDDYSEIPNETTILYTSDHGQTLFKNGRASHGGDSKEEASVPLFLIGKFDREPDTMYAASHSNIFATLLDLMNFPTQNKKRQFAISLLTATRNDSKPRFYNPALMKKLPFDY